MPFQRVMDLAALGDGELVRVNATPGGAVCLARVGESVYAIQPTCSHAAYPMEAGSVESDAQVECGLHGAVFDLQDGVVIRGPATQPLRTYPVKVEAGGIWVDVPDEVT